MALSGKFILSIVIAYFLGNISPSTLIARAMGHDIKKEGSGNAGTTNTLRVLGPKAALATLVIDISKGVVAVLIGQALAGHPAAMACVLAALIGHIWPVMLKFRGGKGVAVSFGALLGLNWQIALTALVIVVVAVLITRKVSMGSVIVAITFPFVCWFLEPDFLVYGIIMAVLVLFAHRSNIVRLIHGEEDKISFHRYKEYEKNSPDDNKQE